MPMVVDSLIYKTGADLSGFGRDLKSLDTMATSSVARLTKSFASIKAPSFPSSPKMSMAGDGFRLPKIDAGPAALSMRGLTTATAGSTAAFVGLAAQAGAALGAVKLVGAGFDFAKGSIKSASDLNEQLNKTATLLGDSAPAIRHLADDFARDFGSSKKDVLGVATSIAALGKGAAGLRGTELEKFSTNLTKLAADFASIDNSSLEEVGRSFLIQLSGEQSDQLKRVGIDTKEAALKQYALSSGIAKIGQEMTESQKVMARAGIITQKLSFANGDLAKTIADPANAYRKFTGQVENLQATIGTSFLPTASRALGVLNDLATAGGNAFDGKSPGMTSFIESLDLAVDTAGVFTRQWGLALEITQVKAGAMAHNLGEGLKAAAQSYVDTMANLYDPLGAFGSKGAASSAALKGMGKPVPGVVDGAIKPAVDAWKPNFLDTDNLIAPLKMQMADADSARVGTGPLSRKPKSAPTAAPAMPIIDSAQIKAMEIERNSLESFAKSFKADIQTPFEEFQGIIAQGRKAFEAGLIKPEEFARINNYGLEKTGLDKELAPKTETRFGAAAELGTMEYVRATNRALYGGPSGQTSKERIDADQLKALRELIMLTKDQTRTVSRNKPKEIEVVSIR